MIVKFPASPLWLSHSLGPLYYWVTSWGLSDCETSLTSLWLWNFLESLNDCDTSCGSFWLWYFLCRFVIIHFLSLHFMIVKLTLWLWHAMRCRSSCHAKGCEYVYTMLTLGFTAWYFSDWICHGIKIVHTSWPIEGYKSMTIIWGSGWGSSIRDFND